MAAAARAGAGARGARRWSASTTGGSRRSRWPAQLVADGRIGDDPARPRAVPAGLDRRPRVPAGRGGCEQDEGRLRRARRHRRAHRRPDPVRHRASGITGVSALLETFVQGAAAAAERRGAVRRRRAAERGDRSPSTTPRSSSAGFAGGAIGVVEATRFATGRKNAIRVEVNGSTGSLAFDFEDMNVLEFFDGTERRRDAGLPPDHRHRARPPVRRRVVAARATWLGYEHGFTHQVVDLVDRDRRRHRPAAVVRRRAAGAARAGRRREPAADTRLLAGDPRT